VLTASCCHGLVVIVAVIPVDVEVVSLIRGETLAHRELVLSMTRELGDLHIVHIVPTIFLKKGIDQCRHFIKVEAKAYTP
jgi:hypothetical protein